MRGGGRGELGAGATGAAAAAAARRAGELRYAFDLIPAYRLPRLYRPWQASYAFDGEGYRCYELRLPSPQRAVQLFLRGTNVIGSSAFAINVLISHRGPTPSFSEHAFRYLYESKPPHKHAGKFLLSKARLQKCCLEQQEAAGAPNSTAVCEAEPLVLWVAFKGRAVAVTELTVTAAIKKENKGVGPPVLSKASV